MDITYSIRPSSSATSPSDNVSMEILVFAQNSGCMLSCWSLAYMPNGRTCYPLCMSHSTGSPVWFDSSQEKAKHYFFFAGVGIASISRNEDSKRDLVELYTLTWCFGDYSQIRLNYVFWGIRSSGECTQECSHYLIRDIFIALWLCSLLKLSPRSRWLESH